MRLVGVGHCGACCMPAMVSADMHDHREPCDCKEAYSQKQAELGAQPLQWRAKNSSVCTLSEQTAHDCWNSATVQRMAKLQIQGAEMQADKRLYDVYLGLAAASELARLRVLICLKLGCWSMVVLVMLVPLL